MCIDRSPIELTDMLVEKQRGRLALGVSQPDDITSEFGPAEEEDDRYAPHSSWFMDYGEIEFYFHDARRLKMLKIVPSRAVIAYPGEMGVTTSRDRGSKFSLFGQPASDLMRITKGLAALPENFDGRINADPQARAISLFMKNGPRSLEVNYVLESLPTKERTFDVDYHLEAIRVQLHGGWG